MQCYDTPTQPNKFILTIYYLFYVSNKYVIVFLIAFYIWKKDN